jgi:hypothetical protein
MWAICKSGSVRGFINNETISKGVRVMSSTRQTLDVLQLSGHEYAFLEKVRKTVHKVLPHEPLILFGSSTKLTASERLARIALERRRRWPKKGNWLL